MELLLTQYLTVSNEYLPFKTVHIVTSQLFDNIISTTLDIIW